MDAREASQLAKAYFEEMSGAFGVVFFQIQSVQKTPSGS